MAYDIDPEQSVSIVALFLFLDAAFIGFRVLQDIVGGGVPPLIPLLLVAGLIAAGVGLLQGRQWAWWLAMVVIVFLAIRDLALFNLIGLLIDALVIFLLTRPSTRARFGVR
jgi:hypothetical protein